MADVVRLELSSHEPVLVHGLHKPILFVPSGYRHVWRRWICQRWFARDVAYQVAKRRLRSVIVAKSRAIVVDVKTVHLLGVAKIGERHEAGSVGRAAVQ